MPAPPRPTPPRPVLAAIYFDGTSACAQPVMLQLCGDALLVTGQGIDRAVPLRDVRWPERTRHGQRVAHFKGGGSVQCADATAWDAWSQRSGQRDSWVVSVQQSWRGVMASVLVLVLLIAALHQWGLPVAARAVVAALPLSVDQALGESAMTVIDQHLMRPSQLPLAEQARVRAAFTQALAALPPGEVPPWQLVFRASRIGPNAFALPGGLIIMTDELVELVGRDVNVLTAVLAHEIGHVHHRHGLRLLVQVTVVGGVAAVVLGDFSTLLASLPSFLAQASYSRQAEREADAHAVHILQAAAISPAVMVTLFEKLADFERKLLRGKEAKGKGHESVQDDAKDDAKEDAKDVAAKAQTGDATGTISSWLGIAFSSHPPNGERVQYFKDAAAKR